MKKLLTTLTALLGFSGIYAQGIAGTWYGSLNIPGSQLHIVFHISKAGNIYTTTWDSPDQGATGLTTDKTTVDGNELLIEASKFGIKYKGNYLPDSNKINGMFTQGMASLPLNLSDTPSAVASKVTSRPQDPKDFPYKQEEVAFTNAKAGNRLAGTLTMPANGRASKIVILISGSGPQNRNEELAPYNHRPFLVWSDWLTRQGIAVLRYDDRGIGQSTGDFATATTADFADDAEAAVNYILSRPDLKNLSIGLLGHSEGGMVAPMIASRNKSVKFLVLLAAPGVPVADLMLQQNADQMRLAGAPENVIQLSAGINKKVYTTITQNPKLSPEEMKVKIDTVLYQSLRSYPRELLAGANIDDLVRTTSAQVNTPWFRYFVTFNPANYLTKVKCPVLAINGTLDMQVQSSANLASIQSDLRKAGNTRFETMAMPNLNHLFQQAKTGAMVEYGQNTETVNPAALQKVSAWINQLKL